MNSSFALPNKKKKDGIALSTFKFLIAPLRRMAQMEGKWIFDPAKELFF